MRANMSALNANSISIEISVINCAVGYSGLEISTIDCTWKTTWPDI